MQTVFMMKRFQLIPGGMATPLKWSARARGKVAYFEHSETPWVEKWRLVGGSQLVVPGLFCLVLLVMSWSHSVSELSSPAVLQLPLHSAAKL